MENIIIRKATPDDAEAAVPLILLSGHGFMEAYFGPGENGRIARLFREPRNAFSHEYALMLELSGSPAGMVLFYGHNEKKKDYNRTALLFLRIFGPGMLFRIPYMLRSSAAVDVIVPGDCYISNIAVSPGHAGKGLGTMLMNRAEESMKERGVKRMVLNADTGNTDAIRLYERLGYRLREGYETLAVRGKSFSFYAMEKEL